MHNVTNKLENNNDVRCLMIDFSKVFGTVRSIILCLLKSSSYWIYLLIFFIGLFLS